MLDIHLLRRERSTIETKLRSKDPTIDLTLLFELDQRRCELQTTVQTLKATRNKMSQQVGEYKRSGQDISEIMAQLAKQAEEIHSLDIELAEVEKNFHVELAKLPNIPVDDAKVSPDPKDNVVIREYGEKPQFDFPFKNHVELNEKLHLFDFKRAAKVSGTNWPAYRGMGARLEWALINYMLDVQRSNGFEQWMPPLLVREETVFGSGQLPKFAHQQFKLHDEDFQLYLIPTAEVPLNGMHSGEILTAESLPIKYTAYTPCFRREAGAAGAQERGLIRMHQFNKVEMFCFTLPEESPKMFDWMVSCAEEVLKGLGLHYRSVMLVTGDMSYAAARTVDVEAWLPGQNRYYEVSSVSNCTDFQARRSSIRFRRHADADLEFVHTLNGSGLATSRLMVALLENNQQADGSVELPMVLHKYLDGVTKLSPADLAGCAQV
jgi:seryl-tRNA synthetase